MSDQNEGLYDSVSTPADQPVQTSGVPSRAGASVDPEPLGGEPVVAERAAVEEPDEQLDDETAALAEFDEDTRVVGTSPLEDSAVGGGPGAPVAEDDPERTALLGAVDDDAAEDAAAGPAVQDGAAGPDDGLDGTKADGTRIIAPGEDASGKDAETQAAYERAAREAEVRAQQAEAAARARQKAERDRRLGTVAAAEAPVAVEAPAAAAPAKRTTDRFAGSLGLVLLRIVAAAVVGVLGFQIVTETGPVTDALQSIGVPQADMVAMGVGILALVLAAMILFGLGTRIAAVLLAALAVATLVLFRWGHFNPFVAGRAGFSGDLEFLLAGIGLCLLFVGAGGWSVDAGLRRSRARRKARLQG